MRPTQAGYKRTSRPPPMSLQYGGVPAIVLIRQVIPAVLCWRAQQISSHNTTGLVTCSVLLATRKIQLWDCCNLAGKSAWFETFCVHWRLWVGFNRSVTKVWPCLYGLLNLNCHRQCSLTFLSSFDAAEKVYFRLLQYHSWFCLCAQFQRRTVTLWYAQPRKVEVAFLKF